MSEPPAVSIVIANWNGADHLPDCLDSLAALDYPRDRVEVIVVDNGSTDSSLALLERRYPWVHVLRNAENLGFAQASNAGATAARFDCVAFVNNDLRVDPAWLTHLTAQYEPAAGYVCVAGTILDWTGTYIDFVDVWINVHGAAEQEYFSTPVDEALIEDGLDLPFACGASMLINRQVFLDLGGFDPRYFAFFEDVDFGWRLWLAGHKVRLAARARSFHKGHTTGKGLPVHQRFLLWERNGLLTLIKNVSDENLPAVLANASLLLVDRAVMRSGSDPATYAVGAPDAGETEVVSRSAVAPLHAVTQILAELGPILDDRRRVQALRRRSDEEIFALFRRPVAPAGRGLHYLEASLRLRTALGVDRLFTRQRIRNVLVVAGNGSPRLKTIAESASMFTPVVLASSLPSDQIPGLGFTLLRGRRHTAELLAESDCVIVESTSPAADVVAAEAPGLVLVDVSGGAHAADEALLRRADVVLCSSEAARVGIVAADSAVLVVPDDAEAQKLALRPVLREPWNWRLNGGESAPIEVPEDLQLLLRTWREHYNRETVFRRNARAYWRRLPTPIRTLLVRAVTASGRVGTVVRGRGARTS